MQASDTNIIEPTAATFDGEVGGSSLPVLVDFWAPWCPPCMALKPVIHQLASELAGKARVALVNVSDQPELAERFGISRIPTLMVVAEGKIQDAFVANSRETVLAHLRPYLAA